MLDVEVRNRINRMNPWLTSPDKASEFLQKRVPPDYVQRDIENTPIKRDRAMLVVGPRQAGKSTLVWRLSAAFMPELLFLNLEDPLLKAALTSPVDLLDLLRADYSFVKAIFIDEIQHMDEAGLFVKGLVDAKPGVPIFVTGSSSFHLAARTRESLAGRATRRQLLPFSMRELERHAKLPNPLAEKHACEKIVRHQRILGSYPAVYLAAEEDEKMMLLGDIVEALVLRDASDLFRIKRVDAFRKLLTLLAGQIGSLLNLSELASICGIDVGTVNAYIEILEESHILKRVPPFAGGKRREITSSPKVFFLDNGIRNQLLNNFSKDFELRTDKGQLLENWVFSEIQKLLPLQSTLKFWRSKSGAEVDFVIEHSGNVYALEVKSASLKQPKFNKSAASFVAAYNPRGFAVVNMALDDSLQEGETVIDFITPCSLPLWLDRVFRGETN